MNNKNDAYDKVMGKNTLFSDSALDEMQRTESYRIAFKLFRASFWLQWFLSFAMCVVGGRMNNSLLMVAGIACITFELIIYIIYGTMTSAKGIMPPECVKNYRYPYFSIACVIFFAVFIYFNIKKGDMFLAVISYQWTISCVFQAIMCLLVKRNNNALKEQFAENDD